MQSLKFISRYTHTHTQIQGSMQCTEKLENLMQAIYFFDIKKNMLKTFPDRT